MRERLENRRTGVEKGMTMWCLIRHSATCAGEQRCHRKLSPSFHDPSARPPPAIGVGGEIDTGKGQTAMQLAMATAKLRFSQLNALQISANMYALRL